MEEAPADEAGGGRTFGSPPCDLSAWTKREEVVMPTNINDKLISWASEIDPETIRQAEKTARLPIVEGHVALMHVGMGATVGSVIPTAGAVIPAAVGVDIGCGMIAAELDVTDDQLPDSLEPLLHRIEPRSRRAWGGHDQVAERRPVAGYARRNRAVGRPGAARREQFGTLGSGNHFFELCVDERGRVGGTPLGQPRHRQPARHDAHQHGATLRRQSSCGSRTSISRTSPKAPPNARHTSPTCSGRRSMRGPTAKR